MPADQLQVIVSGYCYVKIKASSPWQGRLPVAAAVKWVVLSVAWQPQGGLGVGMQRCVSVQAGCSCTVDFHIVMFRCQVPALQVGVGLGQCNFTVYMVGGSGMNA
jgi:hypothetical protein